MLYYFCWQSFDKVINKVVTLLYLRDKLYYEVGDKSD